MDPAVLAKQLVALLVMIDPIGMAPLFLAMTAAQPEARRKVALIATLTAMVVLIAGAVIGQYVLAMFGISIASFRVIGGLLFLLIALDMLNARPSRTKRTQEEEEEARTRKELAVVPLGLPLLAGPGAISAVILNFKAEPEWSGKSAVLGVIVAAGVITLLILLAAAQIAKKLGSTGIAILERLMGLILGAIAIEFIAGGLRELLPALAK